MRSALSVVVFSVTLFTPMYGQKYLGDSWSNVKANGSGTLACLYHESPGLIYYEDEEVKGVCVDILEDFTKYIRQEYSITLKLAFTPAKKGVSHLIERICDTPNLLGIANANITDQAKMKLAFSPSYFANPMVLLTGKAAPSLNSLAEITLKFEGYTAVVVRGSSQQEFINRSVELYYPMVNIEYQPNGEAVLERIVTTPNTFTIIDFIEFFKSIKKRLPVKRHDVVLVGPVEQPGFMMQKGSDWQPLWNEFLTKEYKESVRYKKIVASHLGNSFLNLVE